MNRMNSCKILAAMLIAVASVPGAAQAALVLDTGTPTGNALPVTLDGNDFYAAEFSLGSNATITGIQGFIDQGADASGATFTISIYGSDLLSNRFATPVFSQQATYTADGWNGLLGLSVSGLAAGNYWAAFEVGGGDTATGLAMPQPFTGGTAPALAEAFNAGSGYTTSGAVAFGAQVSTVPLPGAAWLLGSGLLGLGGLVRRRRQQAA